PTTMLWRKRCWGTSNGVTGGTDRSPHLRDDESPVHPRAPRRRRAAGGTRAPRRTRGALGTARLGGSFGGARHRARARRPGRTGRVTAGGGLLAAPARGLPARAADRGVTARVRGARRCRRAVRAVPLPARPVPDRRLRVEAVLLAFGRGPAGRRGPRGALPGTPHRDARGPRAWACLMIRCSSRRRWRSSAHGPGCSSTPRWATAGTP